MVTEVAAEVEKMEVVLEGNSKEIAMVDNVVKVVANVVKEVVNVVKVAFEAKAAVNVVKVVLEVKVVLGEKAVANDVKVASKRKVGQVLLTVNHHLENRSRENHNQFKESIS